MANEAGKRPVPLGPHSEWARNVLAAGRCRIQLRETVYQLDEPALMPARKARDVPRPVRRVMDLPGFEYLDLRTVRATPGALAPAATEQFASEATRPPAG